MYLFCPLNALLLSTTVMLYMLTLLILSIIEFADFFYVAAYFDPSLLHFFSHTHLQQNNKQKSFTMEQQMTSVAVY